MAGIRCPPEDSDLLQARASATTDLASDDERSVAADSWSIKSEYGSTMDEEQRHVDAAEVLSSCPPASDYSSDKEVPDANEVEESMLGLKSYWDATYAVDLANFHQHGHAGEAWFGTEVMNAVVNWTKGLCINISHLWNTAEYRSNKTESSNSNKDLSNLSVLDIGTGNGLLLQALAKQGFSDLTGTDYSQGAVDLALNLAARDGFSSIKFLVDDILETNLDRKYQLIMDKGTLDSIGTHPDGPVKRMTYWEAASNLVAPGGILVITSSTSTKDELLQEAETLNRRRMSSDGLNQEGGGEPAIFQYLDHIQLSPNITLAGVEGSRLSIVAFLRK